MSNERNAVGDSKSGAVTGAPINSVGRSVGGRLFSVRLSSEEDSISVEIAGSVPETSGRLADGISTELGSRDGAGRVGARTDVMSEGDSTVGKAGSDCETLTPDVGIEMSREGTLGCRMDADSTTGKFCEIDDIVGNSRFSTEVDGISGSSMLDTSGTAVERTIGASTVPVSRTDREVSGWLVLDTCGKKAN